MRDAVQAEADTSERFFASVADVSIEIRSSAGVVANAISRHYSALATAMATPPAIHYRIASYGSGFEVLAGERSVGRSASLSDALFVLEKDITVEVQRRQSRLLFLHAAALEWNGRAYVFAAESGSGKSTTTWGLLHHGFGYLSDELAPVDLGDLRVHPYPYALGLKADPPEYALPAGVIRDQRTIHVPPDVLPSAPSASVRPPLGGLLFVKYSADLAHPAVAPIGAGEAAARLYPCILNALAHPGRGLDAALTLSQAVPSFVVAAARLGETCGLIRATIDALSPRGT